jgi:hypothetical protein
MIQYFPIVTGSLTVLGNINVSGSITTSGSITISGSITSASFASTASFVALAQSASFASTASSADNFLTRGTLTAQTLVVQTITSSVDFVTGSTRFGSILGNTHLFTGSVNITGSSTTIGTASFQTSGNNGVINLGGNTYYGQVKVDSNLGGIQINSIWGGANSGIIQLTNGTAGNVRLHIADNGNIGIGTTTTVGKLDINTGGNRNVVISNDSTDTGYNIVSLNGSRTKGAYAGIAGGGTADNNLYLNSGVDIIFQNGASFTQRMRTVNDFTLAGGAGGTGGPTQVIGTTSMVGILFVSIGIQSCSAIFIINASNPPVLVSQSTSETRFSITYNSGNTANVYVSGTNIELQNNIQATRAFYCQFFGKLS